MRQTATTAGTLPARPTSTASNRCTPSAVCDGMCDGGGGICQRRAHACLPDRGAAPFPWGNAAVGAHSLRKAGAGAAARRRCPSTECGGAAYATERLPMTAPMTASPWLPENAPFVWRPYCQHKTAPPPLPVASAHGCRLVLADGRAIVDGTASWGTDAHS